MNLKDFTDRYIYRYDPKGYDQWRIPKLEDGKYQDDCEEQL